MTRVLVLGAGQSTPYLIHHLFSSISSATIAVADRDLAAAKRRIEGHPNGEAIELNAMDQAQLHGEIKKADVVVNFLAPAFQVPVAKICIEAKRSMVSASYRSPQLQELERSALDNDLTLVSEFGLDPGIDHMSAMRLIHEIRDQGGNISGVWSYGGGLAEQADTNRLGYVVTWNPRNVVMAGEAGSRFLENNRVRVTPYTQLFQQTWPVEIKSSGRFEAYANRDALNYIKLYGLESVSTMVRATLRYPGFCEVWSLISRLGIANESVQLPNLSKWSWSELIESFLPPGSGSMSQRIAQHLSIHPGSRAIESLEWLGLFDETPIGALPGLSDQIKTPAEALIALLQKRLALPQAGRDRIILYHQIDANVDGQNRRWTSTLDILGTTNGHTGMAKTVGLPAALATLDLLEKTFPRKGCPIPVTPDIYNRYLPKLEEHGISFRESSEPL